MRNGRGGGGIIVNVSSVNGHVPFPVISAYVATKFALEGLSESIAYELEPFGIKVILIEPGAIGSSLGEEVAKTIVQSILSKKPEFRYVVGSDAVTLMQARKNMPYSDFQQMIQKIVQ